VFADRLRGVLLLIDSEDLDELTDPDEFHDHQLVGLRAETPDGEVLAKGTFNSLYQLESLLAHATRPVGA